MSRRRTLDPEERELWRKVTRSVTPLSSTKPAPGPPPVSPLPPQPVRDDAGPRPAPPPLPEFRVGENAGAQSTRAVPPPPLRMDSKTHVKLRRGKLTPEARIDLHGLTLAEAHPELIRFILNARSNGLRLVLVITGKGSRSAPDDGPIPQRPGALRRQVPHWLHRAPLAPAVLQVTEAHLRHGGAGAFYVYLRRQR